MNRISTIRNVMSFKCSNELCLFFDKDNIAYLNNEKIALPQFSLDNQSSSVFADFYSIQSKSGETALYSSIGNRLIFETEYTLVKNFIYDKGKILFSEKTDKRRHRKFHLYDIKGNCFSIKGVNSFQVNHSFFKENWLFFSNSLLKISNLHLPTETTLWQYDTSVLGIEKIGKILGVFGEVLVVFGHKNTVSESYLSSVPDLPIFFGISVTNGSLVWQQDEVFLSGKNERDTHCRISLPFLDKETGRLVIFEAGQYIEIDALTGEICIWQNLHENPLNINGVSMNPFFFDPSQVDENYIYFRTGLGEKSKRAGLGVYNRKEQSLTNLEIIKDDAGKPVEMGPLKIKATKDKLYALDLKNTLHIFERE